jgi:rubrerythrin
MPRRHPRRPVVRHIGVPRADAALERDRRARAACAAKDRYETESEARATALMHVPGRGDRSIPYRCPVCGGWHLTSTRR